MVAGITKSKVLAGAGGLCLLAVGWASANEPAAPAGRDDASGAGEINPRLLRRFAPARTSIDGPAGPANEAQVRLGRMLFFDTRLSKGNDISCNSCHSLERYGVDGEKTSLGHNGKRGSRNA